MKLTSGQYVKILTALSPQAIKGIREWCAECQPNEEEVEAVDTSPDWVCLRYLMKEYEGGLNQFLLDSFAI